MVSARKLLSFKNMICENFYVLNLFGCKMEIKEIYTSLISWSSWWCQPAKQQIDNLNSNKLKLQAYDWCTISNQMCWEVFSNCVTLGGGVGGSSGCKIFFMKQENSWNYVWQNEQGAWKSPNEMWCIMRTFPYWDALPSTYRMEYERRHCHKLWFIRSAHTPNWPISWFLLMDEAYENGMC